MPIDMLCIIVFLGASTPADAAQGRRAVVQNDATLMIGGRTVHLHGIFVPFADDKLCDARFRPVRCGSRAALALRFKVQGFVFCDYRGRRRDGDHVATCAVRCNTKPGACREDLGAWLISQGWAVAVPDAPFDYVVRERVARKRGRGIWGFQADSVTVR